MLFQYDSITLISHLKLGSCLLISLILQDLLNFEDPLNIEAAELYQKNKREFQAIVKEYLEMYAKR